MKYPVSHERWLRDQAEAVTEATRDQRDALQAKLDNLRAQLEAYCAEMDKYYSDANYNPRHRAVWPCGVTIRRILKENS